MNLIVPSRCETEITGFILAGEDKWRGKLCRVELWTEGARCFVDGAPVKIGGQSLSLAKKLLAIAKDLVKFNQANLAMRT